MRRANGTETVVKLSGNRRRPYAVRVSQRDKYGQIVQKALGYFATAREAQEALDEHNRLKAQGLAPAINQMSMTVGQVYEAWSARAYAKVGPQAVCGYAAAWKMRISRFADRKMRDMTLDEWLVHFGRGRKKRTVPIHYQQRHPCYQRAVRVFDGTGYCRERLFRVSGRSDHCS